VASEKNSLLRVLRALDLLNFLLGFAWKIDATSTNPAACEQRL